jgi:hypothetical protein
LTEGTGNPSLKLDICRWAAVRWRAGNVGDPNLWMCMAHWFILVCCLLLAIIVGVSPHPQKGSEPQSGNARLETMTQLPMPFPLPQNWAEMWTLG